MLTNRCGLSWEPGESELNVNDFITRVINEKPLPVLAWAEPNLFSVSIDSTTGRRKDFSPLVAGTPSWSVPVSEARLFWQTSALQVVANENSGCRWTWLHEAHGDKYVYREVPLWTRRDLARFGLEKGMLANVKISALEYRENGTLIAWRLVTENMQNA